MANEPLYAVAQGVADENRLSILNDLYNLQSLPALCIAPGMKILTLGCGTEILELEMAKQTGPTGRVLATDISVEQIEIAKKNAQAMGLNNIEFLPIDVTDVREIPGQFDHIHCRFVLSHLPWEKIEQIIPVLHNKLTEGGLLILEEITTLDSLVCNPSDRGYDQWKACFKKQFQSQKSDPSPGKRIYHYLKEKGYTVSHTSHQPALSSEREKSILSLEVISVSKRLLQNQLISAEEVDGMLSLLHLLEQNSEKTPHYCEVSQVVVKD